MDAITLEMLKLGGQGFRCSQIILILGLNMKGETNPSLVRAMTGLAGGCGDGRGSCGALTGGCCLLALFAGKGAPVEKESACLPAMLDELVEWFYREYGEKCGGIDCRSIRDAPGIEPVQNRCAVITRSVFDQCLVLLNRYEVDIKE